MHILREFKEKIQDLERYIASVMYLSSYLQYLYYVNSFLETHKSSENDERDKPKDRDDSWRT